jgi:hypothetical protein
MTTTASTPVADANALAIRCLAHCWKRRGLSRHESSSVMMTMLGALGSYKNNPAADIRLGHATSTNERNAGKDSISAECGSGSPFRVRVPRAAVRRRGAAPVIKPDT